MALGALLEASGTEKKKLGTALGRLGAKKGAKMGPQNILRFVIFEVPSWGPKSDPHFMAFQMDFMAFQKHFKSFPRALSAAKKVLSSSFLSGILSRQA